MSSRKKLTLNHFKQGFTLFIFIILSLFLSSCEKLRDGTVAPGRKAPVLELHTLDGKPASLEDFRGKLVILNFLASWCEPCADEMPALEKLSNDMKEDLVVVAVGVEDDDAALRRFRDRTKVTFPFLHDRAGYARVRYRLGGYPETFVLNKDGEFLLTPDPAGGGNPTLKFIGPREWGSQSMKAILKKLAN